VSLWAWKLVLTPLLIALATLVARKWGHAVGGAIVGLPLTSGPVSVFLALEQGPRFAAGAAHGTLLGLVAVAAYCLVYSRVMHVWGPWRSTGVAVAADLLVTWLLSLIPLTLGVGVVVVLATLLFVLAAIGPPATSSVASPVPRWDLPFRMTAATAMVLVITGSGRILGPTWSGLLSPLPVFASVMTSCAHRLEGQGAAHRVLRGVIVGSFAFASFFVTVALLVQRAGVPWSYGLATGIALTVNVAALLRAMPERRTEH
jgi:hypothetical protein